MSRDLTPGEMTLDQPALKDDAGQTEPHEARTRQGGMRGLEEQPAFYLVYLVFYFSPWFFDRPTQTDMLVGLAAVLGFIPVYLFAMRGDVYRTGVSPVRAAIGAGTASVLALALTPFNGMSGTFHIYAVTQLAGLRPRKRGLIAMAAISVVYLTGAILLQVSLFEMILAQLIAVIAGLSAQSGYESVARTSVRERGLRLEAELAAVRERERIARDLHDVLGHTLTTIAVKSELASKLMDKDDARAREEILEIRNAARETLKEVRAAVAGMQVVTLGEELTRARSALNAAGVSLSVEGEPPALDARAQSALGLALREAVTNIIRHSNADQARVTFGPGPSLEIEDNGGGGELTGGSGLTGMRRRIEALGGALEADGQGGGVTLRLSLPATSQTDAES